MCLCPGAMSAAVEEILRESMQVWITEFGSHSDVYLYKKVFYLRMCEGPEAKLSCRFRPTE